MCCWWCHFPNSLVHEYTSERNMQTSVNSSISLREKNSCFVCAYLRVNHILHAHCCCGGQQIRFADGELGNVFDSWHKSNGPFALFLTSAYSLCVIAARAIRTRAYGLQWLLLWQVNINDYLLQFHAISLVSMTTKYVKGLSHAQTRNVFSCLLK